MNFHRSALSLAALALCASTAFGQATVNPEATRPPVAIVEQGPAPASRGWWSDAVFYEVFVRSFADSTSGPLANDGIGDLQGLIDRLDYLQGLGVNALWLMPITDSPSYHGYDTTDYRKVETDYGSNDDFKRLAAECRRRNIRIVIDLVLNHCSDEHPWFTKAREPSDPKRDWFIWSTTTPGWKGPWNQTVWHRHRQQGTATASTPSWYYGIFNRDMPDLNYTNPAVTREMHDTARFWLTEMGVDGFRLDAVRHLIEDGKVQENTPATHAWLEDFHKACKAVRADCFNVGEIWAGTEQVAPYVGRGMDSAFEFDLATAMVNAARTGDPQPLRRALAKVDRAYAPGVFSTFLTNHDQTRVATLLKGNPDKSRAAAALLLTLPGIPFIYYGEELGMTGDKPDPRLRTPMRWDTTPAAGFTTAKPWQTLSDDPPAVSVAAQQDDPASLLNWYKRLIKVRASSAALRRGDITVIDSQHAGLFAFTRTHEDETLLVLVNLSSGSIDLPDNAWHPSLRDRLARAADLLATGKPGEPPSPMPARIITLGPGGTGIWRLPQRK